MMKKINLLILMFLISFSMLTANPLQKVAEKTFLIDEIDGAETLGTFFEKLYYSDFDNSIYVTGQFATSGLKETFGSYGRQACLIKMNDKLEIEWIQSEFFSQTDTISRHVVFDINESQNKLEIILAYTTSSTENKNADYFYFKKFTLNTEGEILSAQTFDENILSDSTGLRKNSSLGVVSPSALPNDDINGVFYGKSCSRLNSNVFDDYAYNITINHEEFNVKLDSVKMHSGAMRNDVHYKLDNGNFLFFLVEGMGSKHPSKLYWQNVSENFETLPPEKADCMYDATYPTIDYYADNDKIWSIVSFYDSTEKRYKANLHEFSRKDGAYLGLNRTLQHPFTNHAGRDFKLSRAGKLYAAGLQAFYPDSIDMDTVTGYVRPVGRNSYFLYEKDAGFMDSVFIGKYSAVTYIDHALELSNNKFLIAGNLPKDSSNEYKSSFFMALIDTQTVQSIIDKQEIIGNFFPNPIRAGNTLTYIVKEPVKKAILYDLNGKSTELSLINSQNIRINDDINKGVYSIVLYFDDGRIVSTKIIIK